MRTRKAEGAARAVDVDCVEERVSSACTGSNAAPACCWSKAEWAGSWSFQRNSELSLTSLSPLDSLACETLSRTCPSAPTQHPPPYR